MFFADETEESMDFNTVTAKIRQVLRQETTYTETPPELPEGKDFIKWFLQESKEGNAVHYASAAVMAYRAAGYPARYVEGYHYTDEEAQALIKGDTTEAILTNKNAHAWVEVYVSGAGWMPVEVVPGMYVETYTDQLIEGQPTWQVNSQPEEDGLELEQKGAFGDETEDDQNTSELPSLKKTTAVVLVILYLFLFVFLLLELQRAIRLAIRRKKEKQMDSVLMADICAEKIMRLLKCGGVEGNYNHPFELKQEVVARFPGITERNYERAISLIQKVKFGEMTLMENEKYTLSCFVRRLGDSLYHNRSIFLRMKLRYKILV
jgi:hypothetical protein